MYVPSFSIRAACPKLPVEPVYAQTYTSASPLGSTSFVGWFRAYDGWPTLFRQVYPELFLSPKPGVPRSLRFLQGAGADGAHAAGFLNRIFITSVSFTRTFSVCPYK